MTNTTNKNDSWAGYDEAAAEAWIEKFHSGAMQNIRGCPKPSDPIAADGWQTAEDEKHVHTVMPSRPEGYYHSALVAE